MSDDCRPDSVDIQTGKVLDPWLNCGGISPLYVPPAASCTCGGGCHDELTSLRARLDVLEEFLPRAVAYLKKGAAALEHAARATGIPDDERQRWSRACLEARDIRDAGEALFAARARLEPEEGE